ncbi:hypothetical protein [Streptomyces fructofermentans]|uniref:hypothetical protein n=1 Tax=Streptomyces fructofermentans TaxID=152141 RepID=UPI0037B2AAF6
MDELNTRLAAFEAKENERTIARDFARESGHLLPLPNDPLVTGITPTPPVDRYGMVTVKMCRYSARSSSSTARSPSRSPATT